ncbi:MAG TPA: signal peptidase II [Longimicrobiaceae bacterium]|nr:signal peptidase II [Longimicrobiaceae bacterium]
MNGSPAAAENLRAGKFRLYGWLVGAILFFDILTKYIVQRTLILHRPVEVIGDYFRLTYIFNPGAAFGLHLGPYSRTIFLVLTVGAVIFLFQWYRSTPPDDRLRLVAIASVTGGAIGNLIDRIRSERGVVDFLDVGIGTLRWPVFNIADIAVTTGAVLLAISLWREEQGFKPDES